MRKSMSYHCISYSVSSILYIEVKGYLEIILNTPWQWKSCITTRIYSIAFINESKIILLFLSILNNNSGCHCTAHSNVLSSIKAASISPSGEITIGSRPGTTLLLRLVDDLARHVLRYQREHQRAGAGGLYLMFDIFRIICKLVAEQSGNLV